LIKSQHSFARAYSFVGTDGVSFLSTTHECISATQGLAKDGITKTIAFKGRHTVHGNVCSKCWGFRISCTGSRIGQCS